jgi:hypothetical protein
MIYLGILSQYVLGETEENRAYVSQDSQKQDCLSRLGGLLCPAAAVLLRTPYRKSTHCRMRLFVYSLSCDSWRRSVQRNKM